MSDELIAVAREDLEAFNAGDWDRMRACLAPDSVYEEAGTGRRFQGADEIIEANRGWKSAFPEAHGTLTDAFACGDRVAIEVTWSGTQSGALPLPGGAEVPATNREVRIPACQVMRIVDGKIAEARHYFDMLSMLEQLGTVSERALSGSA